MQVRLVLPETIQVNNILVKQGEWSVQKSIRLLMLNVVTEVAADAKPSTRYHPPTAFFEGFTNACSQTADIIYNNHHKLMPAVP